MRVQCKGTAEQIAKVAEFARFLRQNFPEWCGERVELYCEFVSTDDRLNLFGGWAFGFMNPHALRFAKKFGRDISPETRWFGYVRVPSRETDLKYWPVSAHNYRRVPKFKYNSPYEAMLCIMIHELNHLRESAMHTGICGEEARCVRMEYRALCLWRSTHVQTALERLVISCREENSPAKV